MELSDLIDLYCKEREYQRSVFGSYDGKRVLNIASFLLFLDHYVKKCKENYGEPWIDEHDINQKTHGWFIDSIEMQMQGMAPISVYEDLIKIFTLAGAALETYLNIDVNKWREDGIKNKWNGTSSR